MIDSRKDVAADAMSSSGTTASRARYGVLGFALVITAISYLDRVCISMTAPFIQKDLALNNAQVGYIFSAFTFAYAVFEIPGGWLADRFGPRLMMTRVVLWWSLLTAATGWWAVSFRCSSCDSCLGWAKPECFPGFRVPFRDGFRKAGVAMRSDSPS